MSHWFPSLGDPRKMAIDEFDALLRTWPRVAKLSLGKATEADILEWSSGIG